MANQVALRVLTRPGDEVIAARESHAAWHEAGGAAADAGVQIHEIGQRGVLLNAFGPRTLRAVTHLDVNSAQCAQAAQVLVGLLTDGA